MKIDYPEEEIILDDDEEKYDDVIDKEEVYCAGFLRSTKESRPVERLEPQRDSDKSYLQLRKQKKVTFEDHMLNIKTEMNNNVLTQTNEKIKRMEYSQQTVGLLYGVSE